MQQSGGSIAALLFLTPLILFCLIGVRDQWAYMVAALKPEAPRHPVILLMGGIGWIELGILIGVTPDALAALNAFKVPIAVEHWSNAVSAGILSAAIILTRSGRATHVVRIGAIYLVAAFVTVFAGSLAMSGFGGQP